MEGAKQGWGGLSNDFLKISGGALVIAGVGAGCYFSFRSYWDQKNEENVSPVGARGEEEERDLQKERGSDGEGDTEIKTETETGTETGTGTETETETDWGGGREEEGKQEAGEEEEGDCPNHALVYLKPHAASVGDQVGEFVRDFFGKNSITILKEGNISAEEIESKKLIDQHFFTIAKYAQTFSPSQLAVSEEKKKDFSLTFGITWEKALEEGKVFNATGIMSHLKISTEDLDDKWRVNSQNMIKLAPSLYLTFLKEEDLFVINGFYNAMREKYIRKDAKIHYFVVLFHSHQMSWSRFREQIIGATNPARAHPSSLRGMFYNRWESFGFPFQPNIADNGVHGSAGF